MEAALGYFCRWCARQLNSVATRYRHEELIHRSEKEISANTCAVPDSAAFVKCNICSIITTRDKADIASHNQSQHHLRKLRVYAYEPLQPPQAIPLFPPSRGEDASMSSFPRNVEAPLPEAEAVTTEEPRPNLYQFFDLPDFHCTQEDEYTSAFPLNMKPAATAKKELPVILSRPEDALGRVVLFAFTITDRRGKKSTPSEIYTQDFKKEIKNHKAYTKRLQEIKDKKLKIQLRDVPEVTPYSKLPADVKEHYLARAQHEMDYKYYRVQAVDNVSSPEAAVSAADQEVPASSSDSTSPSAMDVTLERNSPAYVKPGSAPYLLTMFETHHGSYEEALDCQDAVVRISWVNFIRNAYVLSEVDVETSQCMLPLPSECSICNRSEDELMKQRVELQACDGSVFPGRGPTAFPCNRRAICQECREEVDEETGKMPRLYRGTDQWFCEECENTPPTFEGIWGHAICPPRDDPLCRVVSRVLPSVGGKPKQERVNVVIRPLGAPVLENGTNHDPAKDYQDHLDAVSVKKQETWVQQRKREAAGRFLDMFNEAALSSGQQAIIMKGLLKMQQDKIVNVENDVQIFGKPTSLLEWAERGGYGDSFGSIPTTYYLDSSALLQGQADVSVVLLNPLHMTQRILLKEDIPAGAIYYGDGEFLTFRNDGAEAFGGQVQQNIEFRERCKAFPKENGKFAVAVASDKVLASGRTSFPVYLLLLNVNSAFAMLACELLGFFPVPAKRRPHGSKKPERLSREQREAYLQIENDATALTLKLLEEANRQGGANFRLKDGTVKKFNFIVLSLSEDIEGKVPKALISKNWCFRCFNENKSFGSSMPFHVCGEGPLKTRTPNKTFQILISLLKNQSVKHLPTETDERATSLGMKHFKVVNQLLAFKHCFGEGGVYAAMNYDDLHMLFLGLFVLILSAADVLFCRHFKRTKLVQTYEDVHQLVESLLALSPGMNDGVHILKMMRMGWFRLEAWNGVDNECFLSHLLFIFSTHDSLIENGCIRLAFAKIVRTIYSLYVRFKVKTHYRSADLELLSSDIACVLSDLQKLFNLNVDDTKDGRTMDESFSFVGPVPERAKNKFHKTKRKHEFSEENKLESNGSPEEDDENDDEDEQEEGFNVGAVGVNDLPAATLGGHQTRTHKIHAFTMIPNQIRTKGSLDVGSSRIFETFHRLVKAYTKRSNKAKLGAVERQVIRNSVSSRLDSSQKPIRSVKARLYQERSSSIDPNITSEYPDEDSDEEIVPVHYIHTGTGTHAHLKALLNVAATCFKMKAEKPIDEILHFLEVVDLHPVSLHKELKKVIRCDESVSTVGAKLKLAHVEATSSSPQRPCIILSPGMYVLLDSEEVTLYLACHEEGEQTYAWVLTLEPYSGASLPAKKESKAKRRSRHPSSSSATHFDHPIAKLPWFKRRPYSEIRKVRSESILMRLRVSPAFFVQFDGSIDNDGYLLSHGLYNYDLRGKNEDIIASGLSRSETERTQSQELISSSASSSSSSVLISAAASVAAAMEEHPRREVNGQKPNVGDILKLDGAQFSVTSVKDTCYVDDNSNVVFYIHIRDTHSLRQNNFVRSTEKYEIVNRPI